MPEPASQDYLKCADAQTASQYRDNVASMYSGSSWVEFHGGSLYDAKKFTVNKAKVRGQVQIEAPPPLGAANQRPLLHPSYEYRVLHNPDAVGTKLPPESMAEVQPCALTKLEPARKVEMLKGPEGKLATNWGGAGEIGGPSARPQEGSRMVVRSAPNQLKSKWAGVPPRPAAPPPLPTNEKMNAEMTVSLEASDAKSGLLDSVVVTLPKAKKLNYPNMPDRIPGLDKLAETARAPQIAGALPPLPRARVRAHRPPRARPSAIECRARA